MVATSLTRNQVVGKPARGFESHRLRYWKTLVNRCIILQAAIKRRRIEVVATSLTRNQVVGKPARGFESHRLRYWKTLVNRRKTLIYKGFCLFTKGTSNV